MSDENFKVTWDDYPAHLKDMLETFLTSESFTDLTLVCEDQNRIRTHRNVLGASSPVLRNLLEVEDTQSGRAVLYLKGICSEEMQAGIIF